MEPGNSPQKSDVVAAEAGEACAARSGGRWARVGRTVALYTALGTGASVAGIVCSEANVRAETRTTYGTREDPQFRVSDSLTEDEVRSLPSLIGESGVEGEPVPHHEILTSMVAADFEGALRLIEQKLDAGAPTERELTEWRARFSASEAGSILTPTDFSRSLPQFVELCEALRSLGDAIDLNVVNLELQGEILDFHEARRLEMRSFRQRAQEAQPADSLSSIDYAKAIFERVTGHALPAAVTIRREDIAEAGIAGTAETYGQIITVEPMSFSAEVSTLCHEMGHLIARPGEEFESRQGFFQLAFGAPRDRRLAVLEEAAAFAFERVCIGAIPDDGVRQAAVRSFENQLLFNGKLFFRGDTRLHPEAGVVSDAACRVLGSPAEAYTYLSTTTELSPAITCAIEEGRAAWALTSVGRCKAAADALRAMSKRVQDLRERFDPEHSRSEPTR